MAVAVTDDGDVDATRVRRSFLPTDLGGCMLWLCDDSRLMALAQPSVTAPDDLTNAAWTKSGSTIASNVEASPYTGAVTADKIVTTATGPTSHYVSQSISATTAAGIPTTHTVALKAAGYGYALLSVIGGVQGDAGVNLATGAITGTTGGATATARLLPNGWVEVAITFTTTSGCTLTIDVMNGPNVATDFWFTGDGVGGILVANSRATQDRASQWSDRSVNAQHVAQVTIANQFRWSAAGGPLGRPMLVCDATNDELVASAVSALLKPLHDGTGGTVFVVCKPTTAAGNGTVWTTGANFSTTIGGAFIYDGTNQRVAYSMSNGAAFIISIASGASSVARSVPHVLTWRYSESDSPKMVLRCDGTQVASADTTGTPSSGNPAVPFTLNHLNSGASYMGGEYYELAVIARSMATADVQRVERMLGKKWGIAVA